MCVRGVGRLFRSRVGCSKEDEVKGGFCMICSVYKVN